MSEHIWERVLARVEAKLNRHTFLTWFKPTRFVRENGDTLMVEVPDGTVRDWLLRHYASILAEALAEAGRPGAVVSFVPGRRHRHPRAVACRGNPDPAVRGPGGRRRRWRRGRPG